MPKEIIHHAGTEQYRGELSWSREGEYVQLATGEMVMPNVTDAPVAEHPEFRAAVYVHLDRKGVNDLIRNLRRARNTAFGADE
jgi:hypothetical protein